MIAEKRVPNPLVYDKETGVYQKVVGPKYHYHPLRPKNPLVYDKETGVYQMEERQIKRAKIERHSGESLDVPLVRTYATSIMSVPPHASYANSREADYIKRFEGHGAWV